MGRSRSRSRSYSRDRYSNSGSDSRSRSSSPEGHRIHVADLGLDPSKSEVERQFERFGPLIEVWVAKNPPCFAFVVYKYKEDAEKAIQDMDGKVIGGSRIRVSYARPRTKGRRRRGFDPNLRCYQCGERGHFSRDCDEIWRQRRKNRERERRRSRKSPSKSKSHSHSRSRSGSRHKKSRLDENVESAKNRSQSQSKRTRKESDKSKSEKKSKSHDRSKDKESSKSPQHKKSASKSPREKASSSKSSEDKETSRSPRALDPETSGSRSPAQQHDVASVVKEHQDLPPPAEKMSGSGSPDARRSVTPDDRSRSRSPYKRSRSRSPAPDSRSPEHEISPINGEGDDYL